jgi:hypothetical protein
LEISRGNIQQKATAYESRTIQRISKSRGFERARDLSRGDSKVLPESNAERYRNFPGSSSRKTLRDRSKEVESVVLQSTSHIETADDGGGYRTLNLHPATKIDSFPARFLEPPSST